MKRYYLYAGYYELWISDRKLGAPLTPISWHKSFENAINAAERYDEYAQIIIDERLKGEIPYFCEDWEGNPEYLFNTAAMNEYAA